MWKLKKGRKKKKSKQVQSRHEILLRGITFSSDSVEAHSIVPRFFVCLFIFHLLLFFFFVRQTAFPILSTHYLREIRVTLTLRVKAVRREGLLSMKFLNLFFMRFKNEISHAQEFVYSMRTDKILEGIRAKTFIFSS